MVRKRIIIITGPGFEDNEVGFPHEALLEKGFKIDVATSNNQEVIGKHGYTIKPTVKYEELKSKNYDCVIIPGGHEAPDRVRQVKEILAFVREMFKTGKIISSTCHGPWVLISAGIMRGKKATCYPGMKDDLINAGARYKVKPVVVDENIITSDHPRNLGPWVDQTIKRLS